MAFPLIFADFPERKIPLWSINGKLSELHPGYGLQMCEFYRKLFYEEAMRKRLNANYQVAELLCIDLGVCIERDRDTYNMF